MKNKLLSILICGVLALSFVGYSGKTYQEVTNNVQTTDNFTDGYFTIITEWGILPTYRIVYANDTKVKYIVFFDGYRGGISPLYNADGTLQIFNEE